MVHLEHTDPTLASAAMKHIRTKPSPHSALKRVPRNNKDHAYMYKVVRSVNLEAYALTVQFQRGAMGYIPTGVLSIRRNTQETTFFLCWPPPAPPRLGNEVV